MLDIVLQGRQQGDLGFIGEEFALALESGAVLVLQHFEVEGELGDFHGSGVQIHPVDVLGQDLPLESDGQMDIVRFGVYPAKRPVFLLPDRALRLLFLGWERGRQAFLPMFAHTLEGAYQERA